MSSLAPRDVLVGLLAVRRGLIAADELDSVLMDSAREGADSLAESLSRRLGPVVWAELLQSADQQLSGIDSIPPTEIPPPHPGATVVEGMGASSDAPGVARPSAPRYTRTHQHAEGGLGVVYGAWDEELGREVALKEIKERHADRPGSRARFVFEAEVTGRLEHPGIVPVYGLGVYADGRPFYAMRFVKGQSLDQAILRFHEADKTPRDQSERALTLRNLLGRFVGVCNAVAYAHSRGIIHRDLKPANVMLGDFGETLVVDWGLAKAVGAPEGRMDLVIPPSHGSPVDSAFVQGETPRSPAKTEQGAVVGTPNYVPPEQALGEADQVGPHSDVYSLGATLYQLLTGKMPVDADTIEETLEKVIRGAVLPARQANARVPAALEAVCRKAMAVEPNDRYASARKLAEEVDRYLADEPVEAYAEPVTVRLRRWAKRNRTLVSSAVVLLLAGVVGLSVGLWAVDQQRKETVKQRDEAEENLKRAVVAEKDAKDQRDRALAAEKKANDNLAQAQKNLDLAIKAVDECFGLAKDHKLLQKPEAKPIKKLLLEKTLPFYKNFRVQRPDDPKLAADQVEYLVRVGYITAQIGSKSRAVEHFEQARKELLALHEASPADPVIRQKLAAACAALASVLHQVGRVEQAERVGREAHSHFLALRDARPNDTSVQNGLASVAIDLASVRAERGDLAGALKDFALAEQILQELREKEADEPDHVATLAGLWINRGQANRNAGRLSQARRDFDRARVACEGLHRKHDYHEYAHKLAVCYQNLGGLLIAETGGREEARKLFDRAQQLFAALVKRYPDVTDYQVGAAQTFGLAFLDTQSGKLDEALAAYDKARTSYLALTKEHPDVPRYRLELAVVCNDMGEALRNSGRWDESMKRFEEGREQSERLHRDHPHVSNHQLILGCGYNNVGLIAMQTGRLPLAATNFAQAEKHLRAVLKDNPESAEARLWLGLAQNNLAYLNWANGKPQEAIKACLAARETLDPLRKTHPKLHQGRHLHALTYLNQGRVQMVLGQTAEAMENLELARSAGKELVKDQPGVTDYKNLYGLSCALLGVQQNIIGRHTLAITSAEEAAQTFTELLEIHKGAVLYQSGQGISYFVLAMARMMIGELSAAAEDARQARKVYEALYKDHADVVEFRSGLALACFADGMVAVQQERNKEADASLERAQKLFRQLAKDHPQVPDFQVQLAASCFLRTITLCTLEQPAEARKQAAEAHEVYSKLAQEQPNNVLILAGRAASRFAQGMPEYLLKKPDKAVAHLEASRDELLALDARKVLLPPHKRVLGLVCSQLADLHDARGQPKKAAAEFERSLKAFEALVESDPKLMAFQMDLASAAMKAGVFYKEQQQQQKAVTALRQARRTSRIVNKATQGTPQAQLIQGTACTMLAQFADTPEDALELLDEGLPLLEAVLEKQPKNNQFIAATRASYLLRAITRMLEKQFEGAIADANRTIALTSDSRERMHLRAIRATIRAMSGDHRAASEEALELARDKDFPADGYFELARALAQCVAAAERDKGRPLPEREKNAELCARQALRLLRRTKRLDLKELKTGEEFAALRKRADFREWLKSAVEDDNQ